LAALSVGALAIGALFLWVNMKIKPFVTSVTRSYAENTVMNTLNDIVRGELEKNEYDFIDVTYSPTGEVAAVSLNSVDINLLRARLIEELKSRIADLDEKEIGIPIGNFLPYHFLSGMGPKIPVRFLLLSNTSADVKESFASRGINQTLYSISFDVKTKVGVYIPTMSGSSEAECSIPIAQVLISGRVPDSYTNVSGADGDPEDIVLNMGG